ncbi:uncharacterized protein LOC126065180 isoform X2 [Elephas maximus indicus]|uniref:uncharacterized protein LOC126065180 isoform X2 n=1 Tax=Elephas maximus indicus TaxID=99487 RepID=UPI002116EDCF|nr:uncharacterized protein LOC126065180 isoform X2 [Elephas maximus indicus]
MRFPQCGSRESPIAGELDPAVIIYNPGLLRSATCQDDRVGISGQLSHPSRWACKTLRGRWIPRQSVIKDFHPPEGGPSFTEAPKMTCAFPSRASSLPRLKITNDLLTGVGMVALNSPTPLQTQPGTVAEKMSAPGSSARTSNERAQARGQIQESLKAYPPQRPPAPIASLFSPQTSSRTLLIPPLCCGKKKSLLLSTRAFLLLFLPNLSLPAPRPPGVRKALLGSFLNHAKFLLFRSFCTPSERPSRSSSPASWHLRAHVGSRTERRPGGACALGTDERAWLPAGAPCILPEPAARQRAVKGQSPGPPEPRRVIGSVGTGKSSQSTCLLSVTEGNSTDLHS